MTDHIKALIIQGKTDKALEQLKLIVSAINMDAVLLLQARLSMYKKQMIRGLSVDSNELNNINNHILSLITADQANEKFNISDFNHSNTYYMGNIYNIGQAGAAGDHASASNFTQQQISSPDYNVLLAELANIKSAMAQQATIPDHQDAIAAVERAEQAARQQNKDGVINNLKAAGKWALDFVSKVGASLVAEMIKGQLF